MPKGWEWDETLYLGSAPFYVRGRQPYAPGLTDRLADALDLDGTGRLIDVGCGPGVVAIPLARWFAEVVGVDPDEGMLTEAAKRSDEAEVTNVRWVRARAEELPLGLGNFRVGTFAQSFHWMDRESVAVVLMGMIEPGGALVHISDVKEPRANSDRRLPYPTPPYREIVSLVRQYLGPVQRAGQGELRHGSASGEAEILTSAGFIGPERIQVPAVDVLERSVDDLVAWTWSMSGSAPHLFGDRLADFERDVRSMLNNASYSGMFSESPPDTEVFIWRTPTI